MIQNLVGEEWRDVVGYEGLYKVSNMGRVMSLHSYGHNKVALLTPTFDNNGYLQVSICFGKLRKIRVHRLVAEAFIPNPDNLPQVNHIDENKTNNRADNLEWCNATYNLNYGTRNKRAGETLSNILGLPVRCVETGIVYKSITDAEKQTGINNICRCCRGVGKTAGGYHWEYATDNKKEQV